MSDVSKWHILVVEDEPDGQEVASGLLGYFNIQTDVAFTAEEGLGLLKQRKYTGIVIDLMLPGMDGWALLKAIRSNSEIARTPCVAITAYHSSAVRQQAVTAGFDGYIPKPLDEISFIRDLEDAIRQAQ